MKEQVFPGFPGRESSGVRMKSEKTCFMDLEATEQQRQRRIQTSRIHYGRADAGVVVDESEAFSG